MLPPGCVVGVPVVPAPVGRGPCAGDTGATSRILTTLTEVIQAGSGAPSRFSPPIWRHRKPTVARWCGRPVACPWGRVGRRAWAPGLSSPTCDPPRSRSSLSSRIARARSAATRSGRWASTVPGDGPVWAPGVGGATRCCLPASVLHAPEGVRDIGTGLGPVTAGTPCRTGDACAAPGRCVARSRRGRGELSPGAVRWGGWLVSVRADDRA